MSSTAVYFQVQTVALYRKAVRWKKSWWTLGGKTSLLLMCTMIYAIEKTLNPLNFFWFLCQFFFGRLSGNLFQMESLRSQLLTTVLRCLPQHKNNRKVSVIAVSYSLNKKKKKQIYLVLFSNEKIKCHLRFYRTFTIKLTIVPNQVLTL